MKPRYAEIERRIQQAAETAVEQMVKADEALAKAVKAKGDLHLMMNSSFLYRDKRLVKTLQSSRHLVTKLTGSGGDVRSDDVSVIDDVNLKQHLRIVESLDGYRASTLQEAVSRELNLIGDVIFVLIGTVKGIRPSEQSVNGGPVKTLRLEPSLSKPFVLEDGTCTTKMFVPIEDLFTNIAKEPGGDTALSENDRQAIAKAYDALLDEAITEVTVTTGKRVNAEETILGRIVTSLQSQTDQYRSALRAFSKKEREQQALNEILRVAYNFSTDVLPVLFLFMSICDLKPLVFWCTVDKQWALYRAFASLPWSMLGRKERLQEYREIVAAARNHAFHHVLPFDTTVEVDLSDVDVRAERMRLFPPYGQKQEAGVRLRDQELVDVFAEFSRAKQRPVSMMFWKENLKVMEAATDLANGILEALLIIHRSRAKKGASGSRITR